MTQPEDWGLEGISRRRGLIGVIHSRDEGHAVEGEGALALGSARAKTTRGGRLKQGSVSSKQWSG